CGDYERLLLALILVPHGPKVVEVLIEEGVVLVDGAGGLEGAAQGGGGGQGGLDVAQEGVDVGAVALDALADRPFALGYGAGGAHVEPAVQLLDLGQALQV